jgi:hypothetical protein
MSLKPSPISLIPEDTSRTTKAALPNGNGYILLFYTFGILFNTSDFKHLS